MINNKAIIPLYLNENMLNNLYTIVIQQFSETNTTSAKDQLVINLKTPLSEFSCDYFGKYMQGDIDIQILKEFSKQREEKISIIIILLLKLRNILLENNLLKVVDSKDDIGGINENDFIEVSCSLSENPVIKKAKDTIKMLEMKNLFYNKKDLKDNSEINEDEMLSFFKNELEQCRDGKCLRYIGEDIVEDNSVKVVVPLEGKNMLDNSDYIMSGKVGIIGKVVKVSDNKERSSKVSLLSGTCFDCIDDKCFNILKDRYSDNINLKKDYNDKIEEDNTSLLEVIPIAIYI